MKKYIVIFCFILFTIDTVAQKRNRFSPDEYNLQHGGSIGYFSTGVGYHVMKNKASLRFFYGFIPENIGGDYHIFSGKLLFKTSKINISDKVILQPANVGIFVAYHASGELSSTWPSNRYPDDYYWWKSSTRFHLALEHRIFYHFENNKVKKVSAYLEWNANELYLASFWQNHRSLQLSEVIKIGFGVGIHFE